MNKILFVFVSLLGLSAWAQSEAPVLHCVHNYGDHDTYFDVQILKNASNVVSTIQIQKLVHGNLVVVDSRPVQPPVKKGLVTMYSSTDKYLELDVKLDGVAQDQPFPGSLVDARGSEIKVDDLVCFRL